MFDIVEIKSYKVGDKIFESLKEAQDYKYQCLDPLKPGDIVSTGGKYSTILGKFGGQGVVCCVDGDIIYYAIGDMPMEWAMRGKIKHSGRCTYEGKKCSWDISRIIRSKLFKIKQNG